LALTLFEILGTFKIAKGQGFLDLRSIEAAGKSTSSSLQRQFQKTGDFVAKSLKVGAIAGAAALTGLATSSLKTYTKYEKGVREVFTLLPGLSDKMKSEMMADVEELSEAIGILPNEVVPALYQAISAGIPQANVFEFMEVAAKASKAGVTDLQTSVDGLTSVVNAYGRENMSAQKAADLFFTTIRLGKTNFEELSRYLFQVVPVAAAVGVNFENVAAAMAEITAKGVPTRVAATQLRAMLNELSTAGSDVNEIFTDLVEMSFTEFIDKGGTLADVIEILNEYADSMGITLKDVFTSIEAGNAALSLGGASLDLFRDKIDQTTSAAGSMETAYEEMAETVQQSLDELAAWWEVTKIEIGRDLQDDFQELLDFLDENKESIKETLKTLVEGLINGLKWLIQNGQAVKTVLAIVAAGLAAILLVTHPVAFGIAAVTAAISAMVIGASAASAKLNELKTFVSSLGGAHEDTATDVEDVVEAFELEEEAAENLRIALEKLRAEQGTMQDRSGEFLELTAEQTRAMLDLRKEYLALGEDLGLTGRQFSEFSESIWAAFALASEQGGDAVQNFRDNVADVFQAYQAAYGEMIRIHEDGTITIVGSADDAAKAQEDFAQRSIDAYYQMTEILAQLRADRIAAIERERQAQEDAVESVRSSIYAIEGPVSSFRNLVGQAWDGLLRRLPKAESTLRELAGVVGELTEEQESLRDSALEVRDEVTGAWDELTEDVAGFAGSFLDSVSEMVRHNRDLAASHEETLQSIEDRYADSQQAANDRRQEQRTALKEDLDAGVIDYQEYTQRMNELQSDYVDAVREANDARTDAIEEEEEAYEAAKRSIGDILKEMGRNLLIAIREELTLIASKHAVLAAIALATGNFVAATQHGIAAGLAGAGAAGLALAGFEKGGIAFDRTFGVFGDTGVPEAVVPLTMGNLGAIGEGVAQSMSRSEELVGAGVAAEGSVEINFYDTTIRDEDDFRKIQRAINDGLNDYRRGVGKKERVL